MQSEREKQIVQRHLTSNLRAILQRKQQLIEWKTEYEAVLDTLRTLPEKVKHQAMIPIGPRSIAFMPGQIKHTNEIYCPLGQNYFAFCSASHARSILNRKILYITKQLTIVEAQLDGIYTRLTAEEINNTNAEVEIVDNAELVRHGEFVEIRETAEDEMEGPTRRGALESKADSVLPQREESNGDDSEYNEIMKMFSALEAEEKENEGKNMQEVDTKIIEAPITEKPALPSALKSKSDKKPDKLKKSVSFSEDCKPESPDLVEEVEAIPAAFSGIVVEKNIEQIAQPPQETKPKRVSRFKASRQK